MLNALAAYDAAIVTAVEGTTRDLVKEQIELNGLPVNIVDTAGLRAAGNEVEVEGIRRAQQELVNADHALIIVDTCTVTSEQLDSLLAEVPATTGYTVVRNKIDLGDEVAGISGRDKNTVCVSALTGAGIDELRRHLEISLGYQPATEGSIIARQRHLQSLRKAQTHFEMASKVLADTKAGELMAEELLQVQNALAEITGQFSSDDLLGRIFESFCIGK